MGWPGPEGGSRMTSGTRNRSSLKDQGTESFLAYCGPLPVPDRLRRASALLSIGPADVRARRGRAADSAGAA